MSETLLSTSNILLFGRKLEDIRITPGPAPGPGTHDPFVQPPGRTGVAHFLDQQLRQTNTNLARIYGFSFESAYYDLPRPMLFLVHGDGADAETVADVRPAPPPAAPGPRPAAQRVARSPDDPSRTGVAAPDFSFADGLKVWSYDKADYTIRMDVETGMFEQVLLDMYFDGGGGVSGARVSGARVSGARVSGARVSGARVSGARVSGARVGGPRGDGSD